MTSELSFISTDNLEHDPYTRSQTRERTLNAAIIRANISESFEEYFEIFDEFYADDIEVGSETGGRTDSWKSESPLIYRQLLGSAPPNGRNRWSVDIYSTDRASWRCCWRDTFRVDTRTGRCIRWVVHRELARASEMEWIARRVRISL